MWELVLLPQPLSSSDLTPPSTSYPLRRCLMIAHPCGHAHLSVRAVQASCAILLYGAKMISPTRAECRQTTTSQRQHCKTGLGPNQHCMQHRHLLWNSPSTTPKRTLFYVPCHCKQLTDWAFLCIEDSNDAPNTTHADNDNDTISFDSTLPEPYSSKRINKIVDGNISWNSRLSSAPPKDNPCNESTTVIQRKASPSSLTA
jgi:hypothetical protein